MLTFLMLQFQAQRKRCELDISPYYLGIAWRGCVSQVFLIRCLDKIITTPLFFSNKISVSINIWFVIISKGGLAQQERHKHHECLQGRTG